MSELSLLQATFMSELSCCPDTFMSELQPAFAHSASAPAYFRPYSFLCAARSAESSHLFFRHGLLRRIPGFVAFGILPLDLFLFSGSADAVIVRKSDGVGNDFERQIDKTYRQYGQRLGE